MLTLPDVKMVTGAVIKQGRESAKRVGGPTGLLANLVPFRSQGAMYAHRYNVERGSVGGNTSAPMASGGQLPRDITVPATAVYVVFSYRTPIAWVDADGTVTVPDVRYSVTTSHHQGQCRAWLGWATPGTSRNAERSVDA